MTCDFEVLLSLAPETPIPDFGGTVQQRVFEWGQPLGALLSLSCC